MDAIASPTVTASLAASAAGFSWHTFRALMGREAFRLLGHPDRGAGQWRRFAPVDVVRLAVLRRLLAHGFALAEADGVLARSVDRLVFGMAKCGLDIPAGMLRGRLAGADLLVCRFGREIGVELDYCGHGAAGAADTVLTLDLGRIAAEALARLASI